jgi:NADPH-dependent 2,4-dienoyl-CoA reductase/sulfur reductase-like enzyme
VAVTVLERGELPLLRVLGREVAQVFAALHRDHGVDLRCGVQVAEITGSHGQAGGVLLADGSRIDADVIIVGVGITPNSQLAAGAGLDITDQYDLGMEYSGYVEPDGYDEVVFRGDVTGREFIAFWLNGGQVLAGMVLRTASVTDCQSPAGPRSGHSSALRL